MAVSLIIKPHAIIHISVCMNKPTAPVGLVATPVALVDASVGPDLHTAAMTLARVYVPLAGVLRAILKHLGVAVLEAVVAGDSLWGFINLDLAICARRRNEPIHIFFPDRLSLGAIVPPWVVALLVGAPNVAQAKGLFGWLFHHDSAWQLGQYDCAVMTLLPNIEKPEWIPILGGVNVTQIDNQAVYDAWSDNLDYFTAWGAAGEDDDAEPILLNRSGGRLTDRSVRRILDRYVRDGESWPSLEPHGR